MAHSILIVEDEPNIVLSVKFLMEGAGFNVRVANNGRAALKEIEKTPPNIVLLDVMLPDRDGYSICEAIKANIEWQDIRILMLTAKGRDMDREKGLALGADDYITKPFSNRELVDRVIEVSQELSVV